MQVRDLRDTISRPINPATKFYNFQVRESGNYISGGFTIIILPSEIEIQIEILQSRDTHGNIAE